MPKVKAAELEPPSMVKRLCGACGAEMRGSDLVRHYRLKTNFQILNELLTMPHKAAEEKCKTLEVHTVYMFKNKHSETNLPKWNTHKRARKVVPEWAKKKEPDVNLNEVMELENNENVTNEVGDPNDSDSMMEKEPELQEFGEKHERELQEEEEVVEVDIMKDKEDEVMEGDQ